MVSAKGYAPPFTTVSINKMGLTLASVSASQQYALG